MTDPVAFIINLASIIGQFESLLRAIVFVMGILLTIQALRLAIRRVEFGPQTVSSSQVLASFVIGICLLAFPQTVSVLTGSLFGTSRIDDAAQILAYTGRWSDAASGSRQAIEAIVLLIQLIGFIAIMRGLLFLNNAASSSANATLGSGVTFIVAGALAVNFPSLFGALTQLFMTSG
ncbi:MAG: hypothetical protein OXE84_00355 [Rhodobacteraceae bacterium]|nr:hypothetical protein [Paracoccaceae bacterium]MCY4196185.1 hypothetical protein [Paracoccaceae bacterium]MCY4327561.1 hypothetical protein [Paracoccaceae bacterium]